MTNISEKSSEVVAELCNRIYPIGSIYMSTNSTNPSELFGGTWTQIKDKFLLSCGDTYSNGATGGEAAHTLVSGEMPPHSHGFTNSGRSWGWGESNASESVQASVQGGYWGSNALTTKEWGTSGSNGSNTAHNNMPPYLAVYIWQRTS